MHEYSDWSAEVGLITCSLPLHRKQRSLGDHFCRALNPFRSNEKGSETEALSFVHEVIKCLD
jgi:hypothetical protein